MLESTPSPTGDHLSRLRAGDPKALNALLAHTHERLRKLAQRMLRGFPQVRRLEQTDDVLQNALLRLCKPLKEEAPKDRRHYYHLATLQIKRVLKDLKRHYYGPEGLGANHHTDGAGVALAGAKSTSKEPSSVAEWNDFLRLTDTLPDEEREVFGLLWYQGLTQQEAAEILGVSVRTVKRLWQSARLDLKKKLGGISPTA